MAGIAPIDPAPRRYPDFVTLKQRAVDGRARVPARTTAADTEAWLLGPALQES